MKRMSLIALLALSPVAAHAGDHVYRIDDPAYLAECGACHVAYPPQLLDAAGWRMLMKGLDRHFGTDASLDEKATAQIGAWLERNAGRGSKRAAADEPRISTTPWFRKEHDEVPSRLWKSAEVKTAAHCGACHRAAERGDYSERSLALPKH